MRTDVIHTGDLDAVASLITPIDCGDAAAQRWWRSLATRLAMHDLLTPTQYTYLIAHLSGQSYSDIAQDHGLSPSTVSRTCSRARRTLSRYMIYGVTVRSTDDVLIAGDLMHMLSTR